MASVSHTRGQRACTGVQGSLGPRLSEPEVGSRWAPTHGWSASPSHPGGPGPGDCLRAKSLGCVRLCDPKDCSPPGSSVHGTLQARTLEWVATPSSRGSSQPRDRAHVSLHWQADSFPLAPYGRGWVRGCLKVPPRMTFSIPGRASAMCRAWRWWLPGTPTGTSPVTLGSEGLRAAGPHREALSPAPKLGIPGPGAHSHATSWQVALDRHSPFSELCCPLCKMGHIPASQGFPGGSVGRASACKAGNAGLNPGSERSPGGGHDNSLEYSCLENPMNREAWCAAVRGVSKSRAQLKPWTMHACPHAPASPGCAHLPLPLSPWAPRAAPAASAEPQTLCFQEPSFVLAPRSPNPTPWPRRHHSGCGGGGEL